MTDPEEECNGLDDDLDGLTDESFADEDANEIPDCLECGVTATVAEMLTVTAECPAFTPADDPWDVEVLWEFMPDERRGCHTAAGDVDADGDVEIVAHCLTTTYLLDGATGAVEWSAELFEYWSPVALANLDGGAGLEIISQNPDSKVAVLASNGTTHFLGSGDLGDAFSATATAISIVVADLDNDGTLEIVSHRGILSGADGSSIDAWDADPMLNSPVAVGDIDEDGDLEIASLGILHDHTGDEIWDISGSLTESSNWSPTPVLVDSTGDGSAQVLWLGSYELSMVDESGSILQTTARSDPPMGGNLACSGDLDGDGTAEMVVSGYWLLEAYELDGSLLWSRDIVDETTMVGCTTFDFDGDGAREVVITTQDEFLMLDGSSGEALFSDDDWFSGTVNDLPIVVDVNGDGSAEVVAASSYWFVGTSHTGGPTAGVPLRVYTHATQSWPDPGRFWPFDSWGGCLLNSDGTPRSTPCRPWVDHTLWRGQPQAEGAGPAWGTDLQLELLDTCRAESTYDVADARLSFRVVNAGPEDHNDDLLVSVYLLDDAGEASLRETIAVGTPLLLGEATDSIEVALQRHDVEHGVLITLTDADGAHPDGDCQADNNLLTVSFDDL